MRNWLKRLFGKTISPEEGAAIHQRQFAQHGLLIVCSKLCIGPDRRPVRHAAREESSHVADSGWVVNSGDESEAYANDVNNYALVPLNRLIETDPTLALLLSEPVGTELTRKHANEPWRWIVGNRVVDQDGRTIAEL